MTLKQSLRNPGSAAVLAFGAMVWQAQAALPLAAEERIWDRASWSGLSSLAVEAGPASIEARAGASGSSLTVEIFDFPLGMRLFADERGGNLKMRVDRRFPWVGLLPFQRQARLVLSIPKGTVVTLGASSGSVRLDGLDASRIKLSASSGSVRANDCSGDLSIATTSGAIKVLGMRGPLDARATSGSISVDSSSGAKSIATSSGRVEILGSRGNLAIHQTSGSARVVDVEGDLAFVASSGSVNLDHFEGILAIKTSSGSITGKDLRLTGDSTLSSTSGRINLDLDNAESELRYDLHSSSGSLSAAASKGRGRLVAGTGSILVRGSSSSGSQEYRAR